MSGGITVQDFKHIPGENDAEYIKLLEEHMEINKQIVNKAVSKVKELSAKQQKKGKWIEFPNHNAYKCSECGRVIETTDGKRFVYKHFPFCHCGAKMEGEQP